MSGEFILGSVGGACALGFMWAGYGAAVDSSIRLIWRIVCPVILIPLGFAIGVGTIAVLDIAGALT